MATSVPPVPNYVYILIRLKTSYTVNNIVAGTLICHYGETNDAFLVGGLVKPGEALMASSIRHCRHLVNFLLAPNDRLYLAKVLNDLLITSQSQYIFLLLMFLLADLIGGLVTILPHWLSPLPIVLTKL